MTRNDQYEQFSVLLSSDHYSLAGQTTDSYTSRHVLALNEIPSLAIMSCMPFGADLDPGRKLGVHLSNSQADPFCIGVVSTNYSSVARAAGDKPAGNDMIVSPSPPRLAFGAYTG